MPSQNPRKAGKKAQRPIFADCPMAGTIRLQIEAATMTPAAKPVSARWIETDSSRRRKNTQPAPAAVPRKGISSPVISTLISG